MDYVTFTDHDTMAAYNCLSPRIKGLVRGVEIKIKDIETVGHTIHVNVFELDSLQFQKLEEIAALGDLHGFLDLLKAEKLPFVYNHPLWFEHGEKPNLSVIPDLIKLFPVIEYNMHRIRRKNEITMELARKLGKGLIASTDTHSGMIGKAYTLSRGKDFREFYNNICQGNSYIVVRDLTKQDLMQEMDIWLDLLSSQDMMSISKRIATGMGNLDRLIAILTSKSLKDFPDYIEAHWLLHTRSLIRDCLQRSTSGERYLGFTKWSRYYACINRAGRLNALICITSICKANIRLLVSKTS